MEVIVVIAYVLAAVLTACNLGYRTTGNLMRRITGSDMHDIPIVMNPATVLLDIALLWILPIALIWWQFGILISIIALVLEFVAQTLLRKVFFRKALNGCRPQHTSSEHDKLWNKKVDWLVKHDTDAYKMSGGYATSWAKYHAAFPDEAPIEPDKGVNINIDREKLQKMQEHFDKRFEEQTKKSDQL